jgi:hypothetical protein
MAEGWGGKRIKGDSLAEQARKRMLESYLAELQTLETRVIRTERRRQELIEEIRQADKSKRADLLSELSGLDWYLEYLQARIKERETIYHG